MVHGCYELQDVFSTSAFGAGGAEFVGDIGPVLQDALPDFLDVALDIVLGVAVGFGVHDGEGDTHFAELFEEGHVYFLRTDAAIEEDEQAAELLALEEVVVDHLLPFRAAGLGYPGITIAWQVHEVPAFVDDEVVEQLCFSGGGGDFGEGFPAGEQVHEARFAHVGASDEGILG